MGVAGYRGPPPSVLIVRPLDSMTAVYHRASGQTHLLASPAPELIESLGADMLTASALIDRLSSSYDLADASPDGIDARLDELVMAGLIERL